MIFNPFEREEHTNKDNSKFKHAVNTLLPLSINQVKALINRKEDFSTLGKIVLIGRIVRIKETVGRTQVHLSDSTGTVTIIEGKSSC